MNSFHAYIAASTQTTHTTTTAVQEQPIETVIITELLERGGSLGVWIALLFFVSRFVDFDGIINDWRKGQRSLSKLSEGIGELAEQMAKNHQAYSNDFDEINRSLRNVSDDIEDIKKEMREREKRSL